MGKEINSYDLSRNWFNFCFDNPEKISPNHTAIYFFAIEHCNRLGWKEKFGFPTQMAMDAIGVKNWRTYKKAFDDLVKFGFIEVVQQSKNQYSANVIAIVKNTKATTKALSKASQKHLQKQSNSIVDIDKLYNNITIKPYNQNSQNELSEKLKKYQEHLLKQTVSDRLGMNLCVKPNEIKQVIVEFIETCYGEIVLKPNEFAVETYFIHWVKAKPTRVQESIENQAKKRHHEQQLQAK